jgi:hypothetical protein
VYVLSFDVEEFKQARFRVSKPLAFIGLVFIVGYIVLGFWALLPVIENLGIILHLLSFVPLPILLQIIIFPLFFILLGFGLSLLILHVFRRHGMLFMWFGVLANIMIGIILILLSVYLGFPLFSIIVLGEIVFWIAMPLLFILIFPGLVERAAHFVEMGSNLIIEEPSIIVPTIFSEVVIVYLAISSAGIWARLSLTPGLLSSLLPGFDPFVLQAANAVVITVLLSPVYWFVFNFFYFFFMSMNVGITYMWYRGVDPTFRDGVAVAFSRLSTIITFSLYAAMVQLLRVALKAFAQKLGVFKGPVEAASGFIGAVWRGINYFTLQAVVIEKEKAWDSIKRSFYMLVKYVPEVVTRELFFKGAHGFFAFLSFSLGLGMTLLICHFIRADIALIIVAVAVAILALWLPMNLVFKTLGVSYNTLVYAWALDQELNLEIPYRLPKVVKDALEAIKKLPSVGEVWEQLKPKREGENICPICNQRIVREAYRCQVCGRLVCKEHSRIRFGKIYCLECIDKEHGFKKL